MVSTCSILINTAGGLGIFLLGMNQLSEGLQAVAGQRLRKIVAAVTSNRFAGIATGTVVTGIVQSSSVVTVMVVGLVTAGLMTLRQAVNVIIGANIGTTVTAWLAALGATTEARRAALAHTLFNCIGVVLVAPLFLPVFVPLLHHFYPTMAEPVTTAGGTVYPHITAPIAMVHTGFNVINTCLFLPFLGPFTALVRRLVPGGNVAEQPRLTMLEPQMMAPAIAVEQAHQEVDMMATCALTMLADFRVILAGAKKDELERAIFETEDKLDRVQHEVSNFLGKVMSAHLPLDVAYRARMLLRVADEYESVSDEVQSLLKMIQRMRVNEMALSPEGKKELLSLHDLCSQFADKVTEAFRKGKAYAPDVLTHMHADSQAISQRIKDVRTSQLQRLTDHNLQADPIKVVLLMDLLNVYRRLKEDCLNIGEALLDEREKDEAG